MGREIICYYCEKLGQLPKSGYEMKRDKEMMKTLEENQNVQKENGDDEINFGEKFDDNILTVSKGKSKDRMLDSCACFHIWNKRKPSLIIKSKW